MRVKSPIKYHGGKSYLASKIVAMMPEHQRYLEAFSGGLSVLLAKPGDGVAEWVNDTNLELVHFWSTLANPDAFWRFQRIVSATPLCEDAFNNTEFGCHGNTDVDRMAYRAARFFIRNRMSRQGLGKDYCTPTKRLRRGMNENVSAWITAVDGLLEVYERMRRVEVWRRDAVEAIQKLDGDDFLVYCDPPYVHETRSSRGEYGDHEMTRDDHEELLSTLALMQGKFILSGYECPLYNDWARTGGWQRHDVDVPNNASSAKTKERKTECLWTNF